MRLYSVLMSIWFVVVIGLSALVGRIENMYTLEGTVVSVCDDEVTIEDNNGCLWVVYDDNIKLNDKVSMLMCTSGTDFDVTDDTIERVKIIK